MYSLKLASEEDYPVLLKMCVEFHKSSPYNNIPMELDKVASIFEEYRNGDKTSLICILLCHGSDVCGVILGHVATLPFSSKKVAGEIIWWVDPEHRQRRGSLMLFEAFEFWGKKVGADFLQVTNTRGTTDLQKFYERKGYSEAEITYVKGL